MAGLHPFRIVLSCTLLFGACWLWSDRLDELAYFFSRAPLIELGEGINVPAEQLKNNSFVAVEGVLGNRAVLVSGLFSGTFWLGGMEIRHMLGTPIFVAFDHSIYGEKWKAYTRVRIQGRLADFGPKSDLQRVRRFFSQRLNFDPPDNAKLLIANEAPFAQWRYPVLFVVSCIIVALSFWFSLRPAFRSQKAFKSG